ncbi:MAG: hypothetical protein AVDCRST_MAG05-1182, partial [uncultured Rubrobacteraceae bacterium]
EVRIWGRVRGLRGFRRGTASLRGRRDPPLARVGQLPPRPGTHPPVAHGAGGDGGRRRGARDRRGRRVRPGLLRRRLPGPPRPAGGGRGVAPRGRRAGPRRGGVREGWGRAHGPYSLRREPGLLQVVQTQGAGRVQVVRRPRDGL